MFIHPKCNKNIVILFMYIIDILVKPIEFFFSDKRMVSIINKRIKEWEDYKVRIRQ